MSEGKKYSILLVCLGNICRSPAAQAVMQRLVDERGLADRFYIDSAGIGAGISETFPISACGCMPVHEATS